jgi:hypothetical protein
MCIKHIINPPQHQEQLIRSLKIEDSMKPIRESQCIKSSLTEVFDQYMPIDRQPDQELKLPGLTTYSGASDNTINICLD